MSVFEDTTPLTSCCTPKAPNFFSSDSKLFLRLIHNHLSFYFIAQNQLNICGLSYYILIIKQCKCKVTNEEAEDNLDFINKDE